MDAISSDQKKGYIARRCDEGMEVFGIFLLIVALCVVIGFWKSDNKLRSKAMDAIKYSGSSMEEPEGKKTERHEPPMDPDILFLQAQHIKPLPRFAMSEKVLDSLLDDHFNPLAISQLVGEIIRHVRMPVIAVDVCILPDNEPAKKFGLGPNGTPRPVAQTQTASTAGRYIHKTPFTFEIQIHTKKRYHFENVVAIACHEVVHHYLREKRIERPDTAANERLTDVAAIYLGMGHHLLMGYAPTKDETKHTNAKGETVTHTIEHTLGYVKYEEIKGLMRETDAILAQEESEEQAAENLRADLEGERQGLQKMLETAQTLLRYNEDLLAEVSDIKTPLDADTFGKIQANVVSRERGDYQAVMEKATLLLNEATFEKDMHALADLNALCQELAAYNSAYQAVISGEAHEEVKTS